jgi:hypothetical protein
MPKYKVSQLEEGSLLDAAVAKAEGWRLTRSEYGSKPELWDTGGGFYRVSGPAGELGDERWRPSTWWGHGGPIIERELLVVSPQAVEHRVQFGWQTITAWVALAGVPYGIEHRAGIQGARKFLGPTPLVAAMRAYVASKLGDEVELLA